MEEIKVLSDYILLLIAAVLCIHNSIFLLIRGKNNRPRKILAITTLLWGFMYLLMFIFSVKGQVAYPMLSGESLISSHIFICIMFLFPLEVLFPKWLNIKRLMIMFTPITILTLIYYLGLKITNQHIEDFMTFGSLWDSIGNFNVWYRFVLLTCNLFLSSLLLLLLDKQKLKYTKWQNNNFSDLDSVDISWMEYYKKMMIAVLGSYLFVATLGTLWSINIHTLIIIISFSILFYKGLFLENTYPDDLTDMAQTIKEEILPIENLTFSKEQKEPISTNEEISYNNNVNEIINEDSFEAKLPSYVQLLQDWMENEKPYLYKDFKLVDVGRVLPLNRSYLSRVFNEGFHQNFSEVVRTYRIKYAMKIIDEHPDLTIYKTAEICGFSSDSSFIKAFQKVTGTTPKQYKIRT